MENHINIKIILRQLKLDLIGKDAHRGVTLTYAWLANQFGHISLGFIPSFLLFRFSRVDVIEAVTTVSVFWFVFELFNFLLPLLFNGNKKKPNVFKPKWKNLAFDTFTDICFFCFGAFLFALTSEEEKNNVVILILLGLSVYLLIATFYWYKTKMYQFYARYPFQFRLSQWSFSLNEKDVDTISKYLGFSREERGNHLLILGSQNTGKTSLGVGIMNELSINNNSCLYVNSMKLFNYFFEDDLEIIDVHKVWDWKTVDFLMVDDVNPSLPIKEELVSPKEVLSFIDTYKEANMENREILSNKNVLWVLGNDDYGEENMLNRWEDMLKDIGVLENQIFSVNLKR